MGKWIRGLFMGSLLGFIGGILVAPRKGEETREKVTRFSNDVSERVKHLTAEAVTTAESVAEKAKSTFGGNHRSE